MTTLDVGNADVEPSPVEDERQSRLRAIFEARPDLEDRYGETRRIRVIARRSVTVEITNTCNLFCEGCLFFEGDDYKAIVEEKDIGVWRDFFDELAANKTRHVYLAGAEPAMKPARLEAAAERIPYGLIVTNGTRQIPKDIPYAVHVSVWGAPEMSATLRGADTLGRALKRYKNDPRVTFLYTISKESLHTLRDMVKLITGEGHRISFNLYSPTVNYLDKIEKNTGNDNQFFRFSNADQNLMLSEDDLTQIRELAGSMIEEFPDKVVYAHSYNRHIAAPGPRYGIDEAGIATDCVGLNSNSWYQLYNANTRPSRGKCCTPNIDCSNCRLYTPGITSMLARMDQHLDSPESFEGWLDICELWHRLMMFDHDRGLKH